MRPAWTRPRRPHHAGLGGVRVLRLDPDAEVDVRQRRRHDTCTGEPVGSAPGADAAPQRHGLDHLPGDAAAGAWAAASTRAARRRRTAAPPGIVAPRFVTGRPDGRVRLSDAHRPSSSTSPTSPTSYYADILYRGHYSRASRAPCSGTLTADVLSRHGHAAPRPAGADADELARARAHPRRRALGRRPRHRRRAVGRWPSTTSNWTSRRAQAAGAAAARAGRA